MLSPLGHEQESQPGSLAHRGSEHHRAMSSSRSGTNGARRARPGVCGRRLIGVSLRGARDSVAAGESWTGGGVSPASRSVTCETGARFVRIRLPAVRFLEAVCPDRRCGGGRGSRLISVSFRGGRDRGCAAWIPARCGVSRSSRAAACETTARGGRSRLVDCRRPGEAGHANRVVVAGCR